MSQHLLETMIVHLLVLSMLHHYLEFSPFNELIIVLFHSTYGKSVPVNYCRLSIEVLSNFSCDMYIHAEYGIRFANTLGIDLSVLEMKALDRNDELTPRGRILARLPIEPRLGKMIIYGCIF